jgi:hypothetical protein
VAQSVGQPGVSATDAAQKVVDQAVANPNVSMTDVVATATASDELKKEKVGQQQQQMMKKKMKRMRR